MFKHSRKFQPSPFIEALSLTLDPSPAGRGGQQAMPQVIRISYTFPFHSKQRRPKKTFGRRSSLLVFAWFAYFAVQFSSRFKGQPNRDFLSRSSCLAPLPLCALALPVCILRVPQDLICLDIGTPRSRGRDAAGTFLPRERGVPGELSRCTRVTSPRKRGIAPKPPLR
jgi:hypothetical protein